MQIKNLTRKISFHAEFATNIFALTKGLSFSKPKNILFKFPFAMKWQFWMFGVSYKIWIAFLDDNKRVVEVLQAIPLTLNPKTWKVYQPKKPCKYILEMPEKLANVNDLLMWNSKL